MQADTLISFLIATAVVTLIPGPNILLIVNDSIQHGIKNGLYAVIGVTIGMIPLFSLSLAGVSTLLIKWTWLFDLVKIVGVVYLVYLGFAMILAAFQSKVPTGLNTSGPNTMGSNSTDMENSASHKTPSDSTILPDLKIASNFKIPSRTRFFFRGVLICITNPKGLLFAGAFFPQFLNKTSPLIPQVLILCGGCLVVATIIGASYAIFAGTASTLFQSERFTRVSSLVSGSMLVLFGVSLFFTNSQALI